LLPLLSPSPALWLAGLPPLLLLPLLPSPVWSLALLLLLPAALLLLAPSQAECAQP
jgi:hypothetical protein